jgi:hypothetical protein
MIQPNSFTPFDSNEAPGTTGFVQPVARSTTPSFSERQRRSNGGNPNAMDVLDQDIEYQRYGQIEDRFLGAVEAVSMS